MDTFQGANMDIAPLAQCAQLRSGLCHDLNPRKVTQHLVEGIVALAAQLVMPHFVFQLLQAQSKSTKI